VNSGPKRFAQRLHLGLDQQQHLIRFTLVLVLGIGGELELADRLLERLARIIESRTCQEESEL
jgi:hypothetical protein